MTFEYIEGHHRACFFAVKKPVSQPNGSMCHLDMCSQVDSDVPAMSLCEQCSVLEANETPRWNEFAGMCLLWPSVARLL